MGDTELSARVRNRVRRRGALASAVLVLALAAAGCAPMASAPAGSEVAVGIAAPITSANPASRADASAVNRAVGQLTSGVLAYPNADGAEALDTSVGRADLLGTEPFRVRYTLADRARWSDGTSLETADLLLGWAALSGRFDDPAADAAPDDETLVDFDATGSILIGSTARLGDRSRSIEVLFPRAVDGWRGAVAPGLPAHVVGRLAFGIDDPLTAQRAVADAILREDPDDLASISRVWRLGWRFGEEAPDPRILVSSGPYRIESTGPTETVLAVNEHYVGDRRPGIRRIILRIVPAEGLAAALAAGDIDVAQTDAAPELVAALGAVDAVTTKVSVGGAVVSLAFAFPPGGESQGPVGDVDLRRALLLLVPRGDVAALAVAESLGAPAPPDSLVFTAGGAEYERAVADNGSAAYGTADPATARDILGDLGSSGVRVCVTYSPADPPQTAAVDAFALAAAPLGVEVLDCATVDPADAEVVRMSITPLPVGPLGTTAWLRPTGEPSVVTGSGWMSEELDELADSLATAERSDREPLLADLDALFWRQAIAAPLYARPQVTAHADRVDGVRGADTPFSVLGLAWRWTIAG